MWMISIDFFKTKNSFNVRFKKEKNHEGRENESSKQVPHSNNKPTVNRKLNQRSPEKKYFRVKIVTNANVVIQIKHRCSLYQNGKMVFPSKS